MRTPHPLLALCAEDERGGIRTPLHPRDSVCGKDRSGANRIGGHPGGAPKRIGACWAASGLDEVLLGDKCLAKVPRSDALAGRACRLWKNLQFHPEGISIDATCGRAPQEDVPFEQAGLFGLGVGRNALPVTDQVVQEPRVATGHKAESRDARAVGMEIGRGTFEVGPEPEESNDHIVDKGRALRAVEHATPGEKNVVVDQERPMVDLEEQVVERIVVAAIPGDAGALPHPIQPDAERGPEDVVLRDADIHGTVEFDAPLLGAVKELLPMDVVDGVSRNLAEGRAHAADDAGLFTVVDVIVQDKVAADGFFVPSAFECPADGVHITLGRIRGGVVKRIAVFAEGDSGAPAVVNLIVLDPPTATPVRAEQTDLLRSGRSPGCRGLAQDESTDGEIMNAGFGGVEHGGPGSHLDERLVGIDGAKSGCDGGLVRIHVRDPFHGFERRVEQPKPGTVALGNFLSVEINGSPVVFAAFGIEPVATNLRGERVEGAEEGIGQDGFPDPPRDLPPSGDHFGPRDLDPLPRCGLINDAAIIGRSTARRIDPFAVNSGVDGDRITGFGDQGRSRDGAQWLLCCAGIGIISAMGDMEGSPRRPG